MPPMKPGTRAYREAIRALRDANDTQDRVGLYAPNDKPARETLVPLGGRMSAVPGTKAFREAFAGAGGAIPAITATTEPATAQLAPGALLSSLPSSNVTTGNYASSVGTISSAVYQTQDGGTGAWTNRATSYAVQDLQAVRVLVTDSEGNTRTWPIDAQVTYAVDPTVSLSVSSATVANGTGAGSALAVITLGNTSEAATLSGPDAALFEIVGTALRNVSTLSTAGTYSVTVNVSNSRPASASAAFSLTVQAAATPTSARIGALTPVGTAWAPLEAADGDYGDLTVSNNQVTARVSPVTSAGSLNVTIVPNTVSVRTAAEFQAFMNLSAAAKSGVTVEWRAQSGVVDTGSLSWFSKFDNLTARVTVQSEDASNPVVLNRFLCAGSGTSGNVTLQDLEFYLPSDASLWINRNPSLGRTIVDFTGANENVTVRRLKVHSDLVPSGQGGYVNEDIRGFDAKGDNVVVEDCEFYDLFYCVRSAATNTVIRNNLLHRTHADFINWLPGFSGQITGNRMWNVVGWTTTIHPDGIQAQGGGTYGALTIEGNVIMMGDQSLRRPGYDLMARLPAVTLSTNTTLTVASHLNRELAANADCTLTLPSAASSQGRVFSLQVVQSNTGSGYTVNISSSDTVPATVVQSAQFTSTFVTWYSDGTQWVPMPAGTRSNTSVTTGRTLDTADSGMYFLLDTRASAQTLNLPEAPADGFEVCVSLFDLQNLGTVQASGSDTLTRRGSVVPRITMATYRQGYRYRYVAASSTWAVLDQWCGFQGIFSNSFTFAGNIRTRGNLIMVGEPNGIQNEGLPPLFDNQYNTLVRAPARDIDGDGTIDAGDGWIQQQDAAYLRARATTIAAYNIISQRVTQELGETPLVNRDNIEFDHNRATPTELSAYHAQFGGTTLEDLVVDDPAEAIARYIDSAVSTTAGAHLWWDFGTNAAISPAPVEATSTPPAAPVVTASDSLSGRTLTITASATGGPTPTLSLSTLTLDGVDVSANATGTGPWSYVVPDSASSQTVAWVVTGTNSEGSDTASDTEVVAANLSAGPDYTDAIAGAETTSNLMSEQPATVSLYGADWCLPAQMNMASNDADLSAGQKAALEAAGPHLHVVDIAQIAPGTTGEYLLLNFRDGADGQIKFVANGETVSVQSGTTLAHGKVDVSSQYGQSAGTVWRLYLASTNASSASLHITQFRNNLPSLATSELRSRMHYTFNLSDFDNTNSTTLEADIAGLQATGIT